MNESLVTYWQKNSVGKTFDIKASIIQYISVVDTLRPILSKILHKEAMELKTDLVIILSGYLLYKVHDPAVSKLTVKKGMLVNNILSRFFYYFTNLFQQTK